MIEDDKGATQSLIRLRNQNSASRWDGAWSDNSAKWIPRLVKQLNFKKEQGKGNFWVSLEEFTQLFEEVTICQMEDNFKYSYKTEIGAICLTQFQIETAGQYTFSVS